MKHNFNGWHIRFISALLTAFFVCGTTGCVSNGNPSAVVDNFDPVPVPEGGWTVESLSKTICINGKELPDPFTCENLGKGYRLKIVKGYEYLFLNNKYVAQVRFKDKSRELDNSKELDLIGVVCDLCKDKNLVTINGLRIGSTCAEAERVLGKPTSEFETEEQIVWNFSENGYDEQAFLTLVFDRSDNTLSIFAFYLM